MHLGLDFDNTIVCYDRVFDRVAREICSIPQEVAPDKLSIRNFFRSQKKEDVWTQIQGYVYGVRIQEAEPYPSLIHLLYKIKNLGWKISIISHKTRYPYVGQQYDLRDPAKLWIKTILNNQCKIINSDSVFFEDTQEDKINRIAELRCGIYVDDLPEIFLSPNFPGNVKKILFDPNNKIEKMPGISLLNHWDDFYRIIEAENGF